MPSTEDLELALEAVERGNLGAVARARHVSQSTVSRAVQRVEAEIGPLFVREGRSVRPAADSSDRVTALRGVVRAWEALRSREADAPVRLSIFCTVTASQTIAPELLGRFRSRHPEVVLDLRTGPASQALEAARSGTVDVAIAPMPDRLPASLAAVPLATTAFVAVTAAPASWDAATVIVPRSGLTRSLVEQWCRRSLRGAWTLQETDTHEEAVAIASLGAGVAVVPALVRDASPLRRHLVELDPPRRLPSLRLGLVARTATVSSGAVQLLWRTASRRG